MLGLNPDKRKKKLQLEHILLRNEAWMWRVFPEWKIEQFIQFRYPNEGKTLVSDAYYVVDQVPHFIEIDRIQHMKVNEEKIQYYGLIAKNIYNKETLCLTLDFLPYQKIYVMKYNVYVRIFLIKEAL